VIGGATMPTLDNITIRGFKSIKAVEGLKLNPVNVLIGANGSGKSNFIELFTMVREVVRNRLRQFVVRSGGANRILHLGSRTTERIDIVIRLDDGNWYELTMAPTAGDSLGLVHQDASVLQRQLFSNPNDQLPTVGQFIDADPWMAYHFHDTSQDAPVKKLGNLRDDRRLRPNGSNLAAFLRRLKLSHPSSYDQIKKTIQLVAPFVHDFVLEPQALNQDMILLEWLHEGTDDYFDAGSLSDGTLRFVALATLLLQPVELRPSVILLDEPELGLHPHAITMLAALVKKASIHDQVILCTQSPTLLDHFGPDDVIVANRVNGESRFERLDSVRLDDWLREYSLGELWEKNEIGGTPEPEPRPL